MPTVKSSIRNFPIIGTLALQVNEWLKLDRSWEKEKSEILIRARDLFLSDSSLNVTKRYGLYLFHDQNNSLIKRGQQFEPEVQSALKVLINLDRIRNNKTVFADVGANIGLHTLFIRTEFPSVDIIAFDPSPSSYKYLELSLAFNHVRNVELKKIALADSDGEMEFYSWGEESSGDSLRDTKRVQGTPKIIKVPAKEMDGLPDLPLVTVIKMDCEGAELAILQGAVDTIKRGQPFILLEFYKINRKAFDVSSSDIFDFLKQIDYSMFTLDFELLDQKSFDRDQENFGENYILMPSSFARAMYTLRSDS